jgi:Flp pilus assembly pilin Flp
VVTQDCRTQKTRFQLSALWNDCQGAAGMEFALIVGTLCFLLLNGIDVARYAYTRMQVHNAAQVGAQVVWKVCDPIKELPATTKCKGLKDKIVAAVQNTSLGTKVSVRANSPSEGYYCLDKTDALIRVSDVSAKPGDCSSVKMPNLRPGQPGNYIKVDVTYQYAPLFLDLTVARFFGSEIASSAQMRLL